MTQTRPQPAAPRLQRLAPPRLEPELDVPTRVFAAVVGLCTAAVAAFLSYAVTAWPPHEDETLALFSGRGTVSQLYETVFRRGGAPLHFTIAWIVAHTDGGLLGLRIVSALFAVASVPVVALLCERLAGRLPAMIATVLLSGSWTLLFHGVYARMYSLFLFTSALSYLALLRALERGGRRAWTWWALAILATTATHTYGAIVIASQGLYALAVRTPWRRLLVSFGAVFVVGIPLWYSDLVLAGRYDVGVGGGGSKLRGPLDVLRYFFHVGGDFTAGWLWAVWPVTACAAVGLVLLGRDRMRPALLAGCVFLTPFALFVVARVGSSASPETRHMIFALPFFLLAVAVGMLRILRVPALAAVAALALCYGEVEWGWQKTPELFRGEPLIRVDARESASAWLAGLLRPNDVLLGYDPLFLGAWEDGGSVSRTVVPRADPKLALKVLREAPKPLGRAVFVFDASDTNNFRRRLYIPAELPFPRGDFTARAWGPFLVVRTKEPVRTVAGFLARAQQAQLLGKSMFIGDADVNFVTVKQALGLLGPG
ncbi:MAG TPA: glycosyltransferase family 39 protein [Gaiellaceae bacterium]